MTTLFADTETFCEVPIQHGTYKYAASAEVIILAYAFADGEVEVVDHPSAEFIQSIIDRADTTVWHNSMFDRSVLAANGVELPAEKIEDTMVRAMAHSLPGSLDKLCSILGVPSDQAKSKDGKQLIQLFCKPRPKNMKLRRATAWTHPAEWQRFREYAGLDVAAMRAIHRKLPRWNSDRDERALWLRDQAINDRGFAVDVDLAEAAIRAVGRSKRSLADACHDLTFGEVQATTQRDALIEHIREFYGVHLTDLKGGTVEALLDGDELPGPVKELLRNRLQASTSSTAKYQKLMNGVSADGRLRGTLQFCGAKRTGRWAGRLFQPTNLMRPTLPQALIEAGIEALKADAADLVIANVMEMCANAMRGVIVAGEGRKLCISDLANIEGRGLAWLAGEEWKLQAFRDFDQGIGADLYRLAYARAFGIALDEVTKDNRQIGKVMELALGFGGAVGAFASMAALYGVVLAEDEVLRIVKAWRRANPEIVSFWYELEDMVKRAIRQPGVTFDCRRLRVRRDGAWLRVVLPSGRALCYPSPQIAPAGKCRACDGVGSWITPPSLDGQLPGGETIECSDCRGKGQVKEQISYMGENSYTKRWERIRTYGGKLVENVTQAVARDVLAAAMPRVEAAGYPIVLSVHDELITEPLDTLDCTSERLSELLATPPAWAGNSFPLAAAGFEAHRYRKD